MLKLFYSPGACSLVSHIALEETGAHYEAVSLNLGAGDQAKPEYLAINPHSRVPALATDDGPITENIAILNFLADRFEAEGSVPRGDAYLSARGNALLGWLASSVHIAFAQIFRPGRFVTDEALHEAVQQGGRAALKGHFAEIDGLSGDGWVLGDAYTAVDSYFVTFYRWALRLGFDVSGYPRWAALVARALQRPAVLRTLEQEGLQSSEFTIS
jgi:glutathione S-transferase